eukprot:s2887_g7.t1
MDLRFVWQAWHLATWTFTLYGRRGTDGTQLGLVTRWVAADAASFCVAGVALGDMNLPFGWRAWRHGLPLCVAGVALMGLSWVCFSIKLQFVSLSMRAAVAISNLEASTRCVAK